ncbi:MAG TPA: cell wall hydrolase [Devosia sp.]|jgi:hypothetical protein|nr:cell wall hydrolase [Devosia sp.]
MGLFGPIDSWARPGHSAAGVLASIALSVLAWPLLTVGAQGPAADITGSITPHKSILSGPTATLTREGDKLVITGSVAMLFNTGSFSGPNRAQKVNRSRLTPDGVTVSSGFDGIRARLAALRTPSAASGSTTIAMGTVPPIGAIRVISVNPDGTPVEGDALATGSVQVASLDPTASAALGAIDQVVPMAPVPMTATPQLAYARETTPPTPTELAFDKFGGKVTTADIKCMADAIYFEARGESYRGQVAVGQVVMNRLHHPIYPKDICQVVYQNQQMRNACQFSFACDGIPETINDPKSWKQAEEIAHGVISGSLYLTEVGKATHYHATYVYPDWAPRLKRVTKIGHHVFYQFKRYA